MTINFTPTELSFLAAAVNDKIRDLDVAAAHIEAERERLGLSAADDETIGLLIRTIYVRLARRLEQQLETPFTDQEEAVRMLFADGTVVVGVR